jgi:hypothetical protein
VFAPPAKASTPESSTSTALARTLEREADHIADQALRMPDRGAPLRPSAAELGTEGAAPEKVQEVLQSPGRALGETERAFFEPRLSCDFSQIRIHEDDAARRSAVEVGARAYTVGQHIILGEAGAASDRRLLAHELAHTIQQQNGPPMLLRQPAPGGPAPAPTAAPAEDPKITALKAELVQSFGLSAVTDSADAKWTLPQLEKMKRGLARVGRAELAAIKGVELRRVKVASEFGSIASGLFEPVITPTGERKDRIEISDKAFEEGDKDFDEGGAKERLMGEDIQGAPSEGILAHEVGHGVENLQHRTVQARRVKAQLAETAATTSLDQALQSYTGAVGGAFNVPGGGSSAEKKYRKNITAAQTKLVAITPAIETIPQTPSADDMKKGAKAVKKAVDSAKKAITERDKAHQALSVDSPAVMADVETTQDGWLTAAEAVVKALEARIPTRTELEKSNDAEAQIPIRMPGAGTIQMTRRLVEFVALVDLNKVDIKGSQLDGHITDNWPAHPEEAFAELYSFSLTVPAGLKKVDAKGELAKFFTSPVGPKGAQKAKVQAWITKHR